MPPNAQGARRRDARDARARRQRRLIWVSVATIVVLVAAIGVVSGLIVHAMTQRSSADPGGATASPSASASMKPFPEDTPAAAPGSSPCTTVSVLTSYENAEMVADLAKAYNAAPRDVDGSCVTVTTAKDKSGTSATRAAAGFSDLPDAQRPAVWMPDSSSWLAVARGQSGGDGYVPATGTSVGTSDIVLAMPQALAKASGWDTKTPTWADVFKASADPDMWSNLGHPEWGTFKLGKTSPLVASSGQAAMLASYGSAAGSLADLTPAQVADPAVTAQVKENELATTHYMATPEHFLWHAREAEQGGSVATFLSAVIVDEESVWDYDRGITSRDGITRTQGTPPKEPLVPIYPKGGFYTADNPAVVLTGSWVSPAQKDAAADFIRYAQTKQGQQVVRTSGYRDLHGTLDASVQQTAHLQSNPSGAIAFPAPQVVTAVDKAFPSVRKRAQVLFLIDVSGSMGDPLPNGQTKLDAAKAAIAQALDYFTAGDEVGLAAFTSDGGGAITPGMVAPVTDVANGHDAFLAALQNLTPQHWTPLYAAVDTYAKQQAGRYDPKKINAMVVLSDGADSTRFPTTTQQQMLNDLGTLHHTTPVLVFTLAYGSQADVPTLQAISSATGAHYYDATDPTKVTSVLGDLVTSF